MLHLLDYSDYKQSTKNPGRIKRLDIACYGPDGNPAPLITGESKFTARPSILNGLGKRDIKREDAVGADLERMLSKTMRKMGLMERQERERRQQQQQAEQQVHEQQIADELSTELGSAAARSALTRMLIQMAKHRAPRPNECVRRSDSAFADRYLAMVGAQFPVTARLCDSDHADHVLARDVVYSLLES